MSRSLIKVPTMRDVDDHVGVSRQLVSLVMRDVPGLSPTARAHTLRDLGRRSITYVGGGMTQPVVHGSEGIDWG